MLTLTGILENISPGICLSVLFILIICHGLYISLLGPLSHIPGPLLGKFSSLWIVLQCRFAKRSESVLKQHKKHGKFVRIAPNHVSISTREALETIYGHNSGFAKGPFYEDKSVEPVLFNTRDQRIHQRKKKYLSPAFSAKNLHEYEPYMTRTIGKFMACLNRQTAVSDQAQIDFNVYSNYLAFDVISDYSFGKSFGFLDKEEDYINLIATIDARGEVLNALGHLPQFIRPMMKYFLFDPFWPKGLRATSKLASIGKHAYYQRKDSEDSRKDLLSFLFKAKDPETKKPLTEQEIIAESISFIVGGSDTTSTTMTNIVDIVSRLPNIKKQLQLELDTAYPGRMSDNWVADSQTVNQLPVLNAVVRETMRLKPTSSTGLERVVPAGGKIIAGKFINEGTLVSVPTLSKFEISRWMNGSASESLDSFYPFSLGPRACIGRNFAWMEILKTLATLFKLFDIQRACPVETQVREGFFVKNSECQVRITRRRGCEEIR
ncbi:cytochrome P450 [Penicillium atrosanguineum]|uniref:Cytochrome P450 n=1 Tax=Penicillium atrosanguineum TaxID=1132637 RepID=A0A9W9PM80_9EURO|nr:cytochrome P450 [Penicillium atrosanguineum]